MAILITLLTAILILTSLVLILLVLIQLPKKETGAGLAFGAGTTDALFGAGSGNVLTKVTKYAAIAFLGLAMLLSVLNMNHAQKRGLNLGTVQEVLKSDSRVPIATPSQPATQSAAPAPALPTDINLAPASAPQVPPAPAPAPKQ